MKEKKLLIACSSGLLLWLAWPPHPYLSPILWIALIPLLYIGDQLIAENKKKKFALLLLPLAIWTIGTTYWVYNAIRIGAGDVVGFFVSFIPWGVGSLLATSAFWLYLKIKQKTNPIIGYISLVLLWTLYEYTHQTWDIAFPWLNLGNGFATTPQLVQWYEYTGTVGGTLWILIANILFYEAYKTKNIKHPLSMVAIVWILVPSVFSIKRYVTYQEAENPCHIVVVQPNVNPYDKYQASSSELVDKLLLLSDSLAKPNTEFFIWPETAIAEYVDEEQVRAYPNYQKVKTFLNKYPNGSVLSGIESYKTFSYEPSRSATFRPEIGKFVDHFNAAILIDNSDKVQFYHKSLLVPAVEKTPFVLSHPFFKRIFKSLGGSTGSYGTQDKPSVLFAESGIGVAPVICYESIWGEYVSQFVSIDAQFIGIITNDGWWGNTSGKDQHLHYARLRAIETRRWVARSANTGISAFINQRGDIVQRAEWWTTAALQQSINLNSELTFYTRHRDDFYSLTWILGLLSIAYFACKTYLFKKK